jgi:hypothetical protein
LSSRVKGSEFEVIGFKVSWFTRIEFEGKGLHGFRGSRLKRMVPNLDLELGFCLTLRVQAYRVYRVDVTIEFKFWV